MNSRPAIIINADIVDFSLRAGQEQKQVVDKLWDYLSKHPFLVNRNVYETVCNGTGDGAMLIFPFCTHGVGFSKAMDFAEDLISHMGNPPADARLRVAVGRGHFYEVDVPLVGRQAVGTGLNACARIVGIGDGGQIVVAEEFVQEWKGDEGDKILHHFVANNGKPFVVWVKHGVPQAIRIYLGRTGMVQVPRRLAAIQIIEKRIEQMLREIEAGVVEAITEATKAEVEAGERLDHNSIDARVSLFAKKPNLPHELHSTEFRIHRHNNSVGPGTTTYSVQGNGTGLVGRAYVAKGHLFEQKLPDYRTDATNYISIMSSRWGLDPTQIPHWQRKARSFITFAYGMVDQEPEGVVCMDMMHPLHNVAEGVLSELGRQLQSRYSDGLTGFMRLRVQA